MTKGQKSLQRTTNFGRPVAASIEAGLTVGAISLRTCSHLPPISGSKMVMPVMLPPLSKGVQRAMSAIRACSTFAIVGTGPSSSTSVVSVVIMAPKRAKGWCVKRDILTVSPADHVDDPSPETSAERALSDIELVALWRAAEGMGYPYGRMVQLLMLTGQRRDEMREARRPEFDLPNRLWKLPGERTKNGREHHVPLSDAALALIEDLPKIKSARGWLFTIEGKVPVSNLAKRKRRLREAMLIELRKVNPDAPEPAALAAAVPASAAILVSSRLSRMSRSCQANKPS
jgi:hypothetical protein